MDENNWKFVELLMCLVGIQTTIILAVFGMMWSHFNSRFEKVDGKFESINDDLKEIRTSLNRMEGAFLFQRMLHA